MPTAGYSGTPLVKKLGLKRDLKLWLIGAPTDYHELLETDVSGQVCPPEAVPDWVHLFAANNRDFERGMMRVLRACRKNPRLIVWVSWYKKSSGKATDLTEDVILAVCSRSGPVHLAVGYDVELADRLPVPGDH